MSWFIFLGIIAVSLMGLGVYVHRRAVDAFGLGRRARFAVAATFAAGLLMLFGGRLLGGEVRFVSVVGTCISLGVLMAAGLVLHVDALRVLNWLVRRIRGTSDEPLDPKRRDLIKAATGTALAVGGSAATYATLLGRSDFQIEEVPIAVNGLAPTMDGYTIVQLSDIHFGTFVQQEEVDAAVELIQRAKPDLVVLTGDLLDHDIRYADFLGQLARRAGELARDGVAAVPGNHDHYAGVDEVLTTLRSAGAMVLLNEGRIIGDAGGAFALLGIDDPTGFGGGRGPDLRRALSMVPDDLPRVLLSHRPELFEENAPHVQLQLSGHTHGGQVSLIYNPAELVLPHRYIRGLYREGDHHIYVNRGFGTAGPPARLGSPPEVSRIILTA